MLYNYEVSLKWDEATYHIVQTDIPFSELSQAVRETMEKMATLKRSRTPCLQITRMDEAGYRQNRSAERKGKRKHPMEREWQRILVKANREKRLSYQRKAKRLRSEVQLENINEYLTRHKKEGT